MLRREFLIQGSVALAGAAVVPSARGADAVAARGAEAAAAGTLMIGGDMQVNRLGFGAMRIVGDGMWGEPKDTKEAFAVLRRAVELGVGFIDTADAYGPLISERLIKEALYPYPRGLVIATKGGYVRPSREMWIPDGRPKHLRAACEASLTRLKLERIDLYQLHRTDPQVPFEDSVGELAKLQKEGKIRHVGLSNVSVAELAKARAIVRVASVQNRLNIVDRGSEDVLAVCEREQIVFIPFAPLAHGREDRADPDKRRSALEAIAKERHIDVNQASLAWLLARSPMTLPIPGTSRVEHLEENVAAAKIKLTPEEVARLS